MNRRDSIVETGARVTQRPASMSVSAYTKNEEAAESWNVDKMTVFQNCISAFNQSGVSSKKSRRLLTQLVRLVYVGDTFSEEDATQLFFTITKLFQKETPGLRQMIYLAIKELRAFTDNVIMGTSVVMKDVQSAHGQIFRPNAIRALGRIIDSSSVESIDRLERTAIVDKDGSVSSAALVSAYHLLAVAKDAVRRWSAETSEALSGVKTYYLRAPGMGGERQAVQGVSQMTQYHALGLLYHMRIQDRVALLKMIQQLGSSQAALRSPHAIVLLIRFISSIIDDDAKLRPTLFGYLEGWLRHRSDMVNLEAAKAILKLRTLTPAEAQSTIIVLQAFLGSPRAPTRFAAIRLLNTYAAENPHIVANCNAEIEGLVTDVNRSIATYAITTLLKTGSETSVDSLIDQISGFMGNDIGDDFKFIVVDALRNLALKFTSKHEAMLEFFSSELHNEGGLELKTTIVDALFDIIRASPDSRDAALTHLCEFIEDSEYTELTVRILHLLGAVGPQASNPSQYVRYIYNRVVLENSLVRAAAVSALSKFALVPDASLQRSINVLLRRCLDDPTDEVRDRAALNLGLLGLGPDVAETFLAPKQKLSLNQLEKNLLLYVNDPARFEKPFSVESVPRISDDQWYAEKRSRSKIAQVQKSATAENSRAQTPEPGVAHDPKGSAKPRHDQVLATYQQALQENPAFKGFGELLHSSQHPIALTESEMEYVVSAVVHVFKEQLVLQFNVDNTYEFLLENVRAELDLEEFDELLEEEMFVPIETLGPNSSGTAYVVLRRTESIVVGAIPCKLRYLLKETEDDEGQEDEYGIQDLELVAGDYINPTYTGSFKHQWDELADEATVTLQFPQFRTLQDTVEDLTQRLGLMPLEDSEKITNENSCTLKMFGKTISAVPVAALVRLVRSAKSGIAGKIDVRTSSDLAEVIATSI